MSEPNGLAPGARGRQIAMRFPIMHVFIRRKPMQRPNPDTPWRTRIRDENQLPDADRIRRVLAAPGDRSPSSQATPPPGRYTRSHVARAVHAETAQADARLEAVADRVQRAQRE
ncbi:hypothetical protein AB0B25_00515 [Nocardia sp. NPDC049190]|uniref:hypothetical protein n=1 Tax=Nocardia sp. NPDC049190 TaxID=3155650 RepID=UPI0033C6EBE0